MSESTSEQFSLLTEQVLSEVQTDHPVAPGEVVGDFEVRVVDYVMRHVADAMALKFQSAQERQVSATLNAQTDPFTGLDNRRGYEVLVRRGLSLALSSRLPVTIVFLDINGIDVINSQKGRSEGNRLILETGRLLLAHTHAKWRPARWGGDEFALIIPGVNEAMTHQWWSVLGQELATAGVPISAGAATLHPELTAESDTVDDILIKLSDQADKLLYRAKEASKQLGENLLFTV